MRGKRPTSLPADIVKINRLGPALIRTFLATGDQAAFGELARLMYPRLQAFCDQLGDLGRVARNEAEDLCQEVMLRVYSSLGKYKGKQDLWLFVRKIAINLSIDWHRKAIVRGRHLQCSLDEERLYRGELEASLKPTALLLKEEVHSIVPLRDRKIVVLHFILGLTQREVVSTLRVKPSTFREAIARFRRRMKAVTGIQRVTRERRRPA